MMTLIAGIVIEELVNECLGKEGHNVFIEQTQETQKNDNDSVSSAGHQKGKGDIERKDDNNTNSGEDDDDYRSLDDEFSDIY